MTRKGIVVGVLIVGCTALAAWYLYYKTAHRESKTFTQIVSENQNFSRAVDILQNGGDVDQARDLLAQEFNAAQEKKQDDVAGVLHLWLALSQQTTTNDPVQLSQYAQLLVSTATNSDYDIRTRKYAFAFIGELFARVIALNDPKMNVVLDTVTNNPSLQVYKAVSVDGATDYRESIITILKNVKEEDNPVILVRLATFLLSNADLEKLTDDAEARQVAEALGYATAAKKYEADVQQVDTANIYSSYLFLRAEVYGAVSTLSNGKYRSLVTEDVDALYEHAISVAAAGTVRGAEASARYKYAKYLLLTYNEQSTHSAAETAALTKKLDSIFQPFKDNELLRKSTMFSIVLRASNNKDGDPVGYANVQDLAAHSPVFKGLLAQGQ